jgi:hypothetical protein
MDMKKIYLIIGCFVIFTAINAFAGNATDEGLVDVPQPPDLPDSVESGEPIEPEVTIIRREETIIEEYRVNGQLYMVKIIPDVGPAYYLIDQDGDGQMESRRSSLYDDLLVPQWVLFVWD